MSRIAPKNIEQIPALQSILEGGVHAMGFMPNDGLIMAHCPDMLKGSGQMIHSILSGGTVDPGLKRMMGYIKSQATGCHYCSAHTSYTALKNGIDVKKMEVLWEFQTHDIFTEKERAALTLALESGSTPNASTDETFDRLKIHFTEAEIVELVFTLSLYSFLNTFNDTIKTDIETAPLRTYNTLKKKK